MSLLTPAGRGAVAVVTVEGDGVIDVVNRFFLPANRRHLADQSHGRILYGRWGSATGEDVVVCRRAHQAIEIHCHGGKQSSGKILADLIGAGCREVPWQDWLTTKNACPIQSAAHRALAEASTERTAAILLDQFQGALRSEILQILQLFERAQRAEAEQRLELLLSLEPLGRHLTRPWLVALAGKPNVGKSSLLNALVGYRRAIVLDQPGTTRDVLSATTAAEGWPIRLLDTAGLHATGDVIERAGMGLATDQLAQANLVIWVLDATEFAAQKLPDWPQLAQQQSDQLQLQLDGEKTLVVVNKVDLVSRELVHDGQAIATCATSGAGIDCLLKSMAAQLVPECPPRGSAVPFTEDCFQLLQTAWESSRQGDESAAVEVLEQFTAPQ